MRVRKFSYSGIENIKERKKHMKNLKKVLALLLAAMMVMGLLSACTKTEEPAAEPTQEASQEETKEESKAEESKAEESKAEESKAEESKEEEPVATDTSVTPRNETFYLTTGQWGTIINNNGFSSNTNNTFCGNNSFTAYICVGLKKSNRIEPLAREYLVHLRDRAPPVIMIASRGNLLTRKRIYEFEVFIRLLKICRPRQITGKKIQIILPYD